MKVSIIVSVYNEEETIPFFIDETLKVLKNNDITNYEIIFVNDGSYDDTYDVIRNISKENHLIKAIHFSKNFGHEAAMIAGIDYAQGDVIICMDCDLQHPPELIPKMISAYEKDGYHIVNMVRENKQRGFSNLFYKIANKLSKEKIAPNASDFFLISKRIADILRNNYRERVRFLRGLVQIVGFRKTNIHFHVDERKYGKSKYSFFKLFLFSSDAIASLSKKPLLIGIGFGLASAVFSIILAIYSIVMKILQQPVSGYTTIIVFLSVMFSIQFFVLGVMGQYIGFLFDEVKARPIYLVDELTNIKEDDIPTDNDKCGISSHERNL